MPTKVKAQLSASMEYDVLGFRWVIARYDVVRTLHETGPWTVSYISNTTKLLTWHKQ